MMQTFLLLIKILLIFLGVIALSALLLAALYVLQIGSIHGYAEWPAHQMDISRWNQLADRTA